MPDDPFEGATGEVRNYLLLKKRGELPWGITNLSDYIRWLRKAEQDQPEPAATQKTKLSNDDILFGMAFGAGLAFFFIVMFFFPSTDPYWLKLLFATVGCIIIILVCIFLGDSLLHSFRPQWMKNYERALELHKSKPFPTERHFWLDTRPALIHALSQHDRQLIFEDTVEAVVKALYKRAINIGAGSGVEEEAQAVEKSLWALEHPTETATQIRTTVIHLLTSFFIEVPPWAFRNKGTALGTVDLIDVMNVKRVAEVWWGTFFADIEDRFYATKHILNTNRQTYSVKEKGDRARKPISEGGIRINVEDFDGTPRELVKAYLTDTLLEPLFDLQITYRISEKSRLEHVHIVAPSGHGKTHGALEQMLAQDIEQRRGLVVISPNDELLQQIARLKILHDRPGDERVTFIDPDDGPALGIFHAHIGKGDLAVTHVLNEISYFCATLIGSELSPPMEALINPLAQLMAIIPGSNLTTFVAAIDDLSKFQPIIMRMPGPVREYLLKEIKTPTITPPTKGAVKARLNSLLFKSPAFSRMFDASENHIDLGKHLDQGGVLLINCNDTYGQELARLLGKYFISRTLQAILQRPANVAPPAYLYIDEAWMFLDQNVQNIIRQARKYGVGLVVAEPDMVHSDQGVQGALEGVAVMLGAGYAASRMAMEKPNPQLVSSMTSKPGKSADFVLFDRHHAKRPVKVEIPMLAFKKMEQISERQYRDYRRRNVEWLTEQAPVERETETPKAEGQDW